MGEGGTGATAAHVPGRTGSVRASAMVWALEDIPEEVARMMVAEGRVFMLRRASKALRTAVETS